MWLSISIRIFFVKIHMVSATKYTLLLVKYPWPTLRSAERNVTMIKNSRDDQLFKRVISAFAWQGTRTRSELSVIAPPTYTKSGSLELLYPRAKLAGFLK